VIGLPQVYLLAGLVFGAYAVLNACDARQPRRLVWAAFWGLFSLSFLAGDWLGDFANGLLAISMVLLAGFGGLRTAPPAEDAAERAASARELGNKLFIPALMVPGLTVLGALLFKHVQFNGQALIDGRQSTLIALAFAALVSAIVAVILLRQRPATPLREGRRLQDAVGWATLLPQMLAALGAVFAVAGVGKVVGDLAATWIAVDSRLAVVMAYCLGMAAFTIIMGNAFAAFPVMTAGIGLPFIVQQFGGDPVIMSAVGMLAGFCGTLMTPMAANFNLVPAVLLDLPDRNGVIKAQLPTALLLLLFNMLFMYCTVFPK